MKKLKTSLIAALVLWAWGAPAAAQVPSLDARVSLNVVEQELSQIVQMLRDRSGANIVILAGAENVVRDLQVSDVHWRDALEYASEMAQCVVEEDSSGVLKVTQPPRVNFDFPDADITEIITTIGKVAGANIIISPDVQGTLTVRLNNVPWRDALEEVAKTRGYVVVQERRDILRVVDPASLAAQLDTRSYQLRYIRPRSNYVPIVRSDFVEGQSAAEWIRAGRPDPFLCRVESFESAGQMGRSLGGARFIFSGHDASNPRRG